MNATRGHRRRGVVWGFWLLLLVVAACPASALAQSKSFSAIQQVWKQRHAANKTMHFTWEGVRTAMMSAEALPTEFPKGRYSLYVDGDKFRREFPLPHAQTELGIDLEMIHCTTTFKDGLETSLVERGETMKHHAGTRRRSEEGWSENSSIAVAPLLLVYRPESHALFGIATEQRFRTDGETSIGGRACTRLVRTVDETNQVVEKIFCSTDEACLPIRYELLRKGQRSILVEYEYEKGDNTAHPRLRSWKASLLGGGAWGKEVLDSFSCKVVSQKFNQPLEDSLFRLTFPPGTLVSDLADGSEVRYVVDDKGEWVPEPVVEP